MACPCGATVAIDGLCDDCASAAIQDLAGTGDKP